MKNWFVKRTDKQLDARIASVLNEMSRVNELSEDYSKLIAILERLKKIKANTRRDPINWNTVAVTGGHLMGVLMLVAYEQKHVLRSSSALSLLLRSPKI